MQSFLTCRYRVLGVHEHLDTKGMWITDFKIYSSKSSFSCCLILEDPKA